jgi:hypothetical protein
VSINKGEPEGPRNVPDKFRTILADPPWDIHQKGARGAGRHYPLMTLERIKAMPIEALAEDDAHLWLWCTNNTLREGYEVAEAFGFTVRAPLTWIKFRLGLGHYLRNATEHLLFATRGNAPVRFRSQPTWILSSSDCPQGRIWSCSPAEGRPAVPRGLCGATRSRPISPCRATRCPATGNGGDSAMRDNGMSPFGNPLRWLFQASLLVLGATLALSMAVDLLLDILPWLIGAGGMIGLAWSAVVVIRWRRSRW